MNMYDLQEILQYAVDHNMMDMDFATVLHNYKDYMSDYFDSLVADEEIDRQKEEDYYADAV